MYRLVRNRTVKAKQKDGVPYAYSDLFIVKLRPFIMAELTLNSGTLYACYLRELFFVDAYNPRFQKFKVRYQKQFDHFAYAIPCKK